MNEQAEYMLIGSVLKDNSILGDITLTPEHFNDISNQNIFRAMINTKRKGFPIDAASLKDELGEAGYLFIGGNARLTELKNCVPSVHAFKSYEQMIMNQWKMNQARDLINEALNDLTTDKIPALIKDLSKVDEEGTQEEFNLSDHLANMYNLIDTEVPKERSGISSGIIDMDNKTDGFQPNDLIIIGARPSIGKTALILNMAINAAQKSNAIPVIFSLEMSSESLIRRMISCIGEINGMKLKNPYHYTNEAEKARWVEAIGVIEKMDLKIYDKPGQKVSEMKAKVRKIKHDNPGRGVLVLIDYLTLIKATSDFKGNTHAQVTEISGDLKGMAKEFKCPVICLAQLSRGVEQRQDKRPFMSDLRESGSIEQDADVIALLYRDEYYNPTTPENKDIMEINIAKNREGEVGEIKVKYKKDINKIENLYHYHNK
ncbi:replicative DNA helicase [Metabacillus dongyingensis]|uniref:replicative DNA helicase n=1 Tax=Metabacillus dongyingensis TaxID=2874282 RepID=UPI003B8D550F